MQLSDGLWDIIRLVHRSVLRWWLTHVFRLCVYLIKSRVVLTKTHYDRVIKTLGGLDRKL